MACGKPWLILGIAAGFGLAAGVAEAIAFLTIQSVLGLSTWQMKTSAVSVDFLWIAPVVNSVLFMLLGVLLVTLAALVRGKRSIDHGWAASLVFAWLAWYILFRVPDRLHWWAAGLLALGLSLRTARLVPVQARLSRQGLGLFLAAAGLAVAGAVIEGGAQVIENRRLSARPPAPPEAPNVLLIVLDTVRADHLSAYGYNRPTSPTLDRFAAGGILFERAISPSAWTVPSHATLFTGRYVHEHRADTLNPNLDAAYPTLAEVLGEHGFATAGFSANTTWVTRPVGLARGFHHFEDFFTSTSDAVSRTVLGREVLADVRSFLGFREAFGRKDATEVSQAFLNWLNDRPAGPYFGFLNFMDAHGPYVSPPPYQSKFMTNGQRAAEGGFAFKPPQVESQALPGEAGLYAAAYDGAINYLDAELGHLFEELDSRDELTNTVVAIVGDHGEAFAEHGLYNHGHSLYLHQVHVPFMLRWPARLPAGIRVDTPVSTRDLPATLLVLAGVPEGHSIPGNSLARLWATSPSADRVEISPALSEVGLNPAAPASWRAGRGWLRSLVSEDWHFIEAQDGAVELYRLDVDPAEVRNIAHTDEGRVLRRSFQRRLRELAGTKSAAASPRARR